VKTAAKLINCTKEEQRSVTRFLSAEGVPGAQIHLRMCAQYGDKVISRRIVYEWIEMFENGRTSVTDAERSGRPATAMTTRSEERTLELIRENRRIRVEEVAGRLNVSVGSACYSSVFTNQFQGSFFIPRGRGCSWTSGALCIRHTRAAIFEHFNLLIDDSTRDSFIPILSTHEEMNLCSRHSFSTQKAYDRTLFHFGAIYKFRSHFHHRVTTLILNRMVSRLARLTSHMTLSDTINYYSSRPHHFPRKYKSAETFWRSLVYTLKLRVSGSNWNLANPTKVWHMIQNIHLTMVNDFYSKYKRKTCWNFNQKPLHFSPIKHKHEVHTLLV